MDAPRISPPTPARDITICSRSRNRYVMAYGMRRYGDVPGSKAGDCTSRAACFSPPGAPRTMNDLAALAWPMSRLPEAIEALARHAGMKPAHAGASPPPAFRTTPEHEEFDGWLDYVGASFGIEVEPVLASGAETEEMLRAAGPALLRYRETEQREEIEPSILLLLRANAHSAHLLSPDLQVVKIQLETVRACLCADAERPVIADVEALLNQTDITGRQRTKIKRRLIQERMAGQRIAGCWLLRTPPSASFSKQLAQAQLPSRLFAMLL